LRPSFVVSFEATTRNGFLVQAHCKTTLDVRAGDSRGPQYPSSPAVLEDDQLGKRMTSITRHHPNVSDEFCGAAMLELGDSQS